MYARYRTRSSFYKRHEVPLKAYGVSPNLLRRPKVKEGLLNGVYVNEKVDLREKERLELLESIRHPKERDFYQDHTYHNQWIQRDLEDHQKSMLRGRYRFFAPNFEVTPWIWYPGDMVEVVSGEGIGQRGSIIAVVKYKNEIVVQNINVQDVVIPASETRPEQVVQREHPISVHRVRHVDPSTNEMCQLELVKVRNKETGELEEKRIALESGVLLPIPSTSDEANVEIGDPLRDTPIQDADEETYDAKTEMPLLVERRLRAMEDYFVRTLKDSYEYHNALRQQNAQDMLRFQLSVVDRAAEKVAQSVLSGMSLAPPRGTAAAAEQGEDSVVASVGASWWEAMLSPYVEEIEVEEEEKAAEAARDARSRREDMQSQTNDAFDNDDADDDADFGGDEDEDGDGAMKHA